MSIVKTYNSDFSNEKFEEIRYGLEGIYLTITKLVIIISLSLLLGIFKEFIILLFLFNIIRFSSFGVHAKKSSHCLISSTTIFICVPLICKYVVINNFIKTFIFLFCLLMFLLYAPADTPKRPLIKRKKRIIYKIITIIMCVIYYILSLFISNIYIANALLSALLIEVFLIHPLTYKLFGVSYNNYKRYVRE